MKTRRTHDLETVIAVSLVLLVLIWLGIAEFLGRVDNKVLFGLVVLEAALSGLPVLVHDSPHFRWMLGPQRNSFVDMVDTDQLGEKLRWSLDHLPELASQMRSLRDELVERFDWSNLVPNYLKMYRQAENASRMTIAEQLGQR